MVQRRCGLRLPLEPVPRGRVREFVGKKLDRDGPVQLGIQRAVNHAHAAFAQLSLDLIAPDQPAGNSLRHICFGHAFPDRVIQHGTLLRQQRFHLAAHFGVGLIKQAGEFHGFTRERGVI